MTSTQMTGTPATDGMTRQGFDAGLPKTTLGKWSMWLAVAFVVGMAINAAFIAVFGTSTDASLNEFSSTYMPYWGIALFGCGFAAGVVGLIAIVRQHERSLITLITLVPALFVIVFLLGEFLVPH